MKQLLATAVAMVSLGQISSADPAASDPFCQLDHTPTLTELESILGQIYKDDMVPNGWPIALQFGDTGNAAAVTNTGPNGSVLSAIMTAIFGTQFTTITMDPNQLNPATSPETLAHEEFHQSCTQTNCALNFIAQNEDPVAGYTGFRDEQGNMRSDFNAQEIYTHYLDYVNYKAGTQAAIDTGTQVTAEYSANWATFSGKIFNQSVATTTKTLDQLTAALANHIDDQTLFTTGTSADGMLHITFDPFPSGQPGIQLTMANDASYTHQILVNYELTDTSVGDFKAGANYLGGAILRSSDDLDKLPAELHAKDIYDAMVDAGYAPADSFDPDDLSNDFYSYATSGMADMTSIGKLGGLGSVPDGVTDPNCPMDDTLHGYFCNCGSDPLDTMITEATPAASDAASASFLASCPLGLGNYASAMCTPF